MTVDPERIDRFSELSWNDGVTALIDDARNGSPGQVPEPDEDWGEIVLWWVGQMTDGHGGLRERMTWFWHTILTTSAEKVDSEQLLADQLTGLREHAVGNYRDLLQGFVRSGALLEFLDASWSVASNPNENLARELMELFTLGKGNYNQDDVRSAARALAGWVVEDGKVEWRRENAFLAPLLFRGVQDDWDTTKIVDHLCDQPETARNISGRLWNHLLGTELTVEGATELGGWWQDQELEILPLIERILTDPSAEGARLNRPRTGLEWFCAFRSVTGGPEIEPWLLDNLGQMPYNPPNVGGWAEGEHWLMPGSLLGRLSLIANLDTDGIPAGRSGTSAEVLDRCGLYEVSTGTLDVVDAARVSDDMSPESVRATTWRLALSSPEFQLS